VPDPIENPADVEAAISLIAEAARRYFGDLPSRPAGPLTDAEERFAVQPLPEEGLGSLAALGELVAKGPAAATASPGPRFFHFVTGGVTPAALGADWMAAILDQNSFNWVSSPLGSRLEQVATGWLKDLLGLPESWAGVLTTGATMANFTGLAAARRWWANRHGVDIEESGFAGLPRVPIFSSGYIHVSAVKALSMLGIGRSNVTRLARDPVGRLDLDALKAALKDLKGAPAILVATAGEVNAGDFDPIDLMAGLAAEHGAWLHVDGAFGLFARATPATADLAAGVERADSVIADGHKWLNVPYDCGFAFVREPGLLAGAFATSAAYLREAGPRPAFGNLGPELSRRARSLAVWTTLLAYGRQGYRAMIERHLELARRVTDQVSAAPDLELLHEPRLNVVCFRYRPPGLEEGALDRLNLRIGDAILADGRVYFGTTQYGGRVAFRPAFSNWRTTEADADMVVEVVRELGAELLSGSVSRQGEPGG
jgi:glutamate/tyrosine decarboxylase-like PLP-dependent enzyme